METVLRDTVVDERVDGVMSKESAPSAATEAASPIDWQALKSSREPVRRAHLEAAVSHIVASSDATVSQEAVNQLQPYLQYSDVCLMCMLCLDGELRRLAKAVNSLDDAAYSGRHGNAEQLLLAFSFPKRLTRQDKLLLQKTQPDTDQRQLKFLSGKAEFYTQLQQKLMAVSQLRKMYGRLWKRFLDCPLPGGDEVDRRCRLLQLLQGRVLNQLTNAQQLADFVMSSFECDSPDVAYSAAACVFHLVYNYSLDYGPLFDRLYQLITVEGLHSRRRGLFYKQLDLMLSSTNLPTGRVAAFAKRLSAVSLLAPCHCQAMLIGLALNLLRRHKNCQYLVHQIEGATDEREPAGRKQFSLSDSLAEAEAAAPGYALWELKALQRHWDLPVGQLAKKANRQLSVVEDFCDKQVVERDWDQVAEGLLPECLKQAEALEEGGYASDEELDPHLDGDQLLAGLDGWQ